MANETTLHAKIQLNGGNTSAPKVDDREPYLFSDADNNKVALKVGVGSNTVKDLTAYDVYITKDKTFTCGFVHTGPSAGTPENYNNYNFDGAELTNIASLNVNGTTSLGGSATLDEILLTTGASYGPALPLSAASGQLFFKLETNNLDTSTNTTGVDDGD